MFRWEASYPRESDAIHAVFHDSSKRAGSTRLTLVIQARAEFSRAHLLDPPESWTRTLLDEAATLHGDWVRVPDLVQSHRWRDARVTAGTELAGPLVAVLHDGRCWGSPVTVCILPAVSKARIYRGSPWPRDSIPSPVARRERRKAEELSEGLERLHSR